MKTIILACWSDKTQVFFFLRLNFKENKEVFLGE